MFQVKGFPKTGKWQFQGAAQNMVTNLSFMY